MSTWQLVVDNVTKRFFGIEAISLNLLDLKRLEIARALALHRGHRRSLLADASTDYSAVGHVYGKR